jgi:VWFA-related protein
MNQEQKSISDMRTGDRRAISLPCRLLAGLLVAFSAFLCPAQARAQEPQKSQQDDVVTLKAHLVNLDVIVRDKKGKYVTDLKAEDFTVFENGVRQRVEFFDPPLSGVNETGHPNPTDAREKRAAPSGRPMNIISLVLDGQTTELANLKQVRDGTLKYLRDRIADTDTVAVFAVTNGLKLLQPFTQDKAKLISAVENAYSITTSSKNLEQSGIAEEIARQRVELKKLEGATDPNSQLQAAMASRVLEQYLKLRSQLSVQQARPILAALAAICEAQRATPGKKTVVLFSQGFIASSTLDWQVQSTIDIANRANVAIYIVDSSGLIAGAPQSGSPILASPLDGVAATTRAEDRIRAVGGENVFDHARHEGLNRDQDILYRISGDSGGKFIKGSNDIAKGLERIDEEIRARYTLAYYSAAPGFDGSFRKLKVEVSRPDAHAISRSGYYAIANDYTVPLSPDDKKLLASFAAAEANPALPLFMELSPFRSQEGRYIIPLSVEVPPTAMKFDRRGEKQHLQFEILGVVREAQDKIVSRLGGSFNVALAAEQYRSILSNKIFYRQDIELAPGSYSVELIVRDRLSGKVAARRERLVLPAADTEFSTSGAVLSSHVEQARKAATAAGAARSSDVLSDGGVEIRPSPSREFRVTDNLIIFFELYNAAASPETGKPLVMVTVTLVKDNKAATKPIDYVLSETLAEPVPHLTFAKYIKLAGLPAGKYAAMIEARDLVTRKLVTQQASFIITQ